MFTGIIEETGRVKSITFGLNGAEIIIEAKKVLEDAKIGDSIAINGVCQTITNKSGLQFSAKISDETLAITTFNNLKTGDIVNLERALTLSSKLGGHIVTGHVDGRGKLVKAERLTDFYNMTFEIPKNLEKYTVYKGAVTINGISLTIAKINKNIIQIAIIPHTYNNTNLKNIKTGEYVNIETDILGRYVEKFLSAKDNKDGISMDFLQKNGFV